ncbi:hypothetical protein D5086_024989 [Populus alba]|uniref:Uncharacterized protein n=1 Tax=Populus alba TaxID=43335 RepID=A0ACC4B7Q2_POPAL
MAVKIRLARLGCKNRAFYRIVAADSHTPRDGKHLQVLGFYDPLAAKGDARRLGLNVDLVKYWLSVGAQPTDTVRGILMRAGLVSPPPMVVMGQKKGPSGDTSNPEKMITQFLYEKPVVSITEHILECTLEILSCLLLVYTSNEAPDIRTYERPLLRPCLRTFGLRFMGALLIYFGLVRVKKQEIGHCLPAGAQASDPVRRLLVRAGPLPLPPLEVTGMHRLTTCYGSFSSFIWLYPLSVYHPV